MKTSPIATVRRAFSPHRDCAHAVAKLSSPTMPLLEFEQRLQKIGVMKPATPVISQLSGSPRRRRTFFVRAIAEGRLFRKAAPRASMRPRSSTSIGYAEFSYWVFRARPSLSSLEHRTKHICCPIRESPCGPTVTRKGWCTSAPAGRVSRPLLTPSIRMSRA